MIARNLIGIARSILGSMGLALVRKSDADALRAAKIEASQSSLFIEFIESLPSESVGDLLRYRTQSKAQLHQDLFVLAELGLTHGGFFVEFGATNGVDLSNSHLLETEFGWQGILAEPGRRWHQALEANRSALIEHDCVWRRSGEKVTFMESAQGEYSTIDSFVDSDSHSEERKIGNRYEVNTVSLRDLLRRNNAPKKIDYLSIDTEGSEYEIVRDFDFGEYEISIITIEHNFGENREKVFDLLSKNGFTRKMEKFSRFDDWFVRNYDIKN